MCVFFIICLLFRVLSFVGYTNLVLFFYWGKFSEVRCIWSWLLLSINKPFFRRTSSSYAGYYYTEEKKPSLSVSAIKVRHVDLFLICIWIFYSNNQSVDILLFFVLLPLLSSLFFHSFFQFFTAALKEEEWQSVQVLPAHF